MRKALSVLLWIVAVAVVVAVAGWLGGPEVAGGAFLMISIGLGAYFGTGWGSNQATKTEDYRQKLLSKRKAEPTQPESTADSPEEGHDPRS